MKYSPKVNFEICIMAMALLLTSCSGKKKEVVYGTIKDVNNDDSEVIATDNRGEEISTARRIEDKYPELEAYSGVDTYPGIYVPVLDKYFDTEKFFCITHNPEYVMLCSYEDPLTTFTFGQINDIRLQADSGQADTYTFVSTVLPMTEFATFSNSTFSIKSLIRADISSTNEEWIGSTKVKGYHLNAMTEASKNPDYVYLACDMVENDAVFALMTSYNLDDSGERKSTFELERNHDNLIYEEAKDAPETVYKVYKSRVSVALPSYMYVESSNNGLRIREKDGEITPMTGAGCTIIYTSSGLNTKQQENTLISELNDISGKNYTFDTVEVNFEENVDFLGVSDATHLSGVMRCNGSGLDMRKSVCGTGEVYYDIFNLTRNGQTMLVMFYRGEAQNEEFTEFIRYNTY